MTLLESWVFVAWIIFADGEANMYSPSAMPTLAKHMTEAECNVLLSRVIIAANDANKGSDKIIGVQGKCIMAQEGTGI